MRIDMHSHVVPPAWPDWARRHGSGPWPNLAARSDGATMLMMGDKPFCPVDERFWSGAKRIADMDRALGALNELLLEQFTTAERGQFLELLGRVVSVLEVQTGRVG